MTARETTDVAVVGAGPAGSAAAITLRRLGWRVTVIDKAVFPRDKCCGDGLTTAALRRAELLGLDPRMVPSWAPVTEAVVVATGGRRITLPFPADGTQYAASAKRFDFDAALLDLARRAGAHVIEGHAVTGVRPVDRSQPTGTGVSGTDSGAAGATGVVAELDDGTEIRANYLVAADGMWSPVRKAISQREGTDKEDWGGDGDGEGDARAGAGTGTGGGTRTGAGGRAEPAGHHAGPAGYLGDWQAGRQYYAGVGPQAKRLWVWFEPDMIPGYAWSFPLAGDCANVGYGVIRQPGQPLGELKGQRIEFLDRPEIAAVLGPQAVPIGPWKAWPIPAQIGVTKAHALGGRVLFVGDAVRACDPMTGEGIAQAFETAELAAHAIAAAGPGNRGAAARRYERRLRWGMAVDDRLSRALSAVLARDQGSAKALRIADTSEWGRRKFARWMFEDYPRAVLVTPHRWRRGMFNRPGAFGSCSSRR
jgi:menaquinone-9 beta-reductase